MRNKVVLAVTVVLGVLLLSGCFLKTNVFKEDYESLNGKTNASGKEHRTVLIDKDNPYEEVSASEIVKKIENGETFYVYFGSKLCPWCRSVIEKSIEVAKEYHVDKIYYVDIWDDEGNEILRDKYSVNEDGTTSVVFKGTEDYFKLLTYFDSLLDDYTLSGTNLNEKRIYAPNFFYIENGKAMKIATGISDKQEGSRDELTKEILEDEEKLFKDFFDQGVCGEAGC